METKLADFIRHTPQGQMANDILRACVHCGFCNATCPTYQILGDERDGPRGRIYQIKSILEGAPANADIQKHLDRCLTCRNCETTCPSGVKYGQLLDTGRQVVHQQVGRSIHQRFIRWLLRQLLINRRAMKTLLLAGRMVSPLLPAAVVRKIPPQQKRQPMTTGKQHSRKVILVQGCVQSAATPNTNSAIARLLDKQKISVITAATETCCGSASHHLDAHTEAQTLARRNIDAWWSHIEDGAEAIISSASGCGVMIKQYAELLENDNVYSQKAQKICAITQDISEFITAQNFVVPPVQQPKRVAFQSPCTLQHGQRLGGLVEKILVQAGYELLPIQDAHLCCGSAGAYSILQPTLSGKLLGNKLNALQRDNPDVIATANIGCQLHLNTQAKAPVMHWVELL